jgi:hypothetical protein
MGWLDALCKEEKGQFSQLPFHSHVLRVTRHESQTGMSVASLWFYLEMPLQISTRNAGLNSGWSDTSGEGIRKQRRLRESKQFSFYFIAVHSDKS